MMSKIKNILSEHRINLKKKKFPDEIIGDYPNGKWARYEYDDNGKDIYYEDSDGYWTKREYDQMGNEIYWANSDGEWEKRKYDRHGNQIYFENSGGHVEYNTPTVNESRINLKPKENTPENFLQDIMNKTTWIVKDADGETYYVDPETKHVNFNASNSYVWVRRDGIWDVLEKKYKLDPEDIEELIQRMFSTHYDLPKYYVPIANDYPPDPDNFYNNFTMDDINPINENIKNNIIPQTMDKGKLKLMEVLTPSDILQINSIASGVAKTESNKVKTELNKNITDIKKKQGDNEKEITKHIQDKKHHMDNSEVSKLAKQEAETIGKDVDKKIDDKLKKNETDMEKKVKQMVADTMVNYHKTLWVKRGFWSQNLSK